jgi:hypothetical protein
MVVPTRSVYLAGRVASSLLVGAAATAVLLVVAAAANGFHVDVARLPAVALVLLACGVCFGALGLALLALMPSARTVNAVTLGTLMPLTFISDVFYVGAELPGQLQAVWDAFPLKHAMHAFTAALGLGAPGSGYAWPTWLSSRHGLSWGSRWCGGEVSAGPTASWSGAGQPRSRRRPRSGRAAPATRIAPSRGREPRRRGRSRSACSAGRRREPLPAKGDGGSLRRPEGRPTGRRRPEEPAAESRTR